MFQSLPKATQKLTRAVFARGLDREEKKDLKWFTREKWKIDVKKKKDKGKKKNKDVESEDEEEEGKRKGKKRKGGDESDDE